MPTLTDDAGRALTLELSGYQHDHLAGIDNDFDANWILVRAVADTGAARWEASGPAFLTWELLELVAWLRAAAHATEPMFFSGFEPNLQFEVDVAAVPRALVAVFAGAFLPDEAGKAEEFPIALTPAPEAILAFADEIEAAMKAVPVRVVQEGGYASSIVGQSG